MFFYLLLLTLLAATVRRSRPEEATIFHRFAVVIPAHNEAEGIHSTITSLKDQTYPPEQFQILVVADNCTDATADIAQRAGAVVMERNEPMLRGKGFALRWCFDQLLNVSPAYDAVVVIDADTVANPEFLQVVNRHLIHGARVIQSSDLVSPHASGWSAQMTRIGFLLYNFVRPLGRRALGGTAGLRGNGMCFRADVLREVPWDAYSISEDLEYGLKLMLKGIRVDFAPDAVVHATMPQKAEHAESQRARWEGGRIGLIRKYASPLLIAAVRRPSFACFDAFLDLTTPALVNLVAYTCILSALSVILALVGIGGMWMFVGLWVFLAFVGFVHLLWGLKVAGADASVYQSLAHLPQYVLWKLKVYRKMPAVGGSDEWVRTTREKAENQM
jgi:cellulose synthase/poly-beta-1,6-N-acetylglucosamine synthase-like glycosyltransferase